MFDTSGIISRGLPELRLHDLDDHPRQAELAGEIPAAQLVTLAEDINRRGLQHPIEVIPSETESRYTIVCGHQRVRAVRRLGWTTVPATIRSDLNEQGEAAILSHLVADNLHRRQQDPIAVARSYRALKLIAIGENDYRELWPPDQRDTRDRIGAVLGISGRQLDRLEELLALPQEIQDAVSRKQLPQVKARAIGKLRTETQLEIASQIAAGDSPRAVAERYLTDHSVRRRFSRQRSLKRSYDQLLRSIESVIKLFGDHSATLLPVAKIDDPKTPILEQGIDFLHQCLAVFAESRPVSPDNLSGTTDLTNGF